MSTTCPPVESLGAAVSSVYERLADIRRRSGGVAPEAMPEENLSLERWALDCPYKARHARLDGATPGPGTDAGEYRSNVEKIRVWVDETVERVGSAERDNAGNLVLCGPKGTGKTWLASAACWELASRKIPCGYVSVIEFFDAALPGGKGISEYLAYPVLFLDDIGSGRGVLTPFQEERLFLLFDRRWTRCRPTIVTTNLEAKTLMEHLGGRIYDRLADGGLFLAFVGNTRRTARWGRR